jgi:hypothetical protein
MKKYQPISIKLEHSAIDLYEFSKVTTVTVQGKHGTAVLTLLPGLWKFAEIKKESTRWQNFLKIFGLYKDRYFIRATRQR